ncbi:hypothetical protein BP5796_10362 [Coleophoma crateriformis]|uniref:Alpha box domain-containing protein n=1 Tax=Coleophoma crateriformis TaxID=565419 RepID=A0A3D8QQD6_9HELO|nr:hypothetical protein BP5796_10362 [Coleophoma crateriformis]
MATQANQMAPNSSEPAPHTQLNSASRLPNEFVLHKIPITAAEAVERGYNIPASTPSDAKVYVGNLMPHPALPEKKRPLNSWMAFRTFYARIFRKTQQKAASSYLTVLWSRDPFKAKWAIVAKAYSSIRDLVGKHNARLDRYLSIVVPAIGIIGAEDYLRTLNWSITATADGSMSLVQTKALNLELLPLIITRTSMTEIEIFNLCAERQYVTRFDSGRLVVMANQARQVKLLAAGPRINSTSEVLARVPEARSEKVFIHQVMTDPEYAASRVFGFDVDQMLGTPRSCDPDRPSQHWNDTMADIYHPEEGHINTEVFTYGLNWQVGDINDPLSFDRILAEMGAVEDGWMIPTGEPLDAVPGEQKHTDPPQSRTLEPGSRRHATSLR